MSYQFEPTCRFVGNAFAHGQLPLWNPYLACGLPEVAELSANIFCPFTLPFAIWPFSKALATILLAHQLICGLGAFLLVEALGWGALAATVAGLVCALNGYMFSVANLYVLACTAAWTPLLIYLLLRMNQSLPSLRTSEFAGVSIVVALQILAGRPEIYAPTLGCVLAWYTVQLIRIIHGSPVTGRTKLGTILDTVGFPLLAVFCGVALAAPSLFPPAEWARLSVRAHGLRPAEVLQWSANWYDWLGVALPQPLGDSQDLYNPAVFLATDLPDVPAFVESAFVGVPVLLLALIGACSGWWRMRWLVLALGLSTVMLASGKYLPILPGILTWAPAISMFRYPVKVVIFVDFFLAILAAAGIKSVMDKRLSKGIILGAAVLLMVLVVPVLATSCGWDWFPIWDMVQRKQSTQLALYDIPKLVHLAEIAIARSSSIAFIFGAACLLICCLYQQGKIRMPLAAGALIVLSLLPLAGEAFTYTRHGTEPNFFSRPSYVYDQLQKLGYDPRGNRSRIAQVYFDSPVLPVGFHAPHTRLRRVDTFQYARQLLDLNLNEDFDVPSIFCYEGRIKGNYWHLCDIARQQCSVCNAENPSDLPLHRLCQLTAVSFVITQSYSRSSSAILPLPYLDASLFKLVHESKAMNVRIFQVDDTLPRAYFRGKWHAIREQDAILPLVVNPLSKYDPAADTYVEVGDKNHSPGGKCQDDKTVVALSVDERTPENVRLQGQFPEAGIVVLADQYYPGWDATVDSVPARILRVNGFEKGVKVSAGNHTVEFTYRPASLVLGLCGFAVGVMILLARFLFGLKSRSDG